MRRVEGRGAIAVALVVALATTSAGSRAGEPGAWERAARPRAAAEARVHARVVSALAQARSLRGTAGAKLAVLDDVLAALAAVDAEHSDDPRLWLDLARVRLAMRDDAAAMAPLERAVREAPELPEVTDALFALAVALARLDRPDDEIAAYEAFLARETEVGARSGALANRAEARMRVGDLRGAIVDYRAAVALRSQEPLTHWGLAVALDRSGDLEGALVEARRAIELDPLDRLLDGPSVFFVPEYDRNWYHALGAISRATDERDAGARRLFWETAVVKWQTYVASAAVDDRWSTLARARLAWTKARLRREAPRR